MYIIYSSLHQLYITVIYIKGRLRNPNFDMKELSKGDDVFIVYSHEVYDYILCKGEPSTVTIVYCIYRIRSNNTRVRITRAGCVFDGFPILQ